jgi:hypothetical protein
MNMMGKRWKVFGSRIWSVVIPENQIVPLPKIVGIFIFFNFVSDSCNKLLKIKCRSVWKTYLTVNIDDILRLTVYMEFIRYNKRR